MTIAGEKTLLITVMRNEGPYILEWIAHHFTLGIDDLLIFTNSCTDNTDKILDRLEILMPHRVKHQPNPKVMFPDRGKWHIMGLRYAGHFGRYKAADWLYVTDADEFLNLKDGINDLDGFFEAAGPADAVSFTSIAFNSNGKKHASRQPVTHRFTETTHDFETASLTKRPIHTGIKTLYRNSISGPRRPHRPVTLDFSKTGLKWVDGSGVELPPSLTDGSHKHMDGFGTCDFAQVNHYIIKSAAEFLLKSDRGDAVNPERLGASESYWTHSNQTGVLDQTGVGLSKDAQEMYDYLLSDPELRALHEESFELRETQLSNILKTEEGEKLARSIGYFD
jgi:hypothetical protein